MTAATNPRLGAALARLLYESAASLQGRGEHDDAIILHDRVLGICRELLGQGVGEVWPLFAASPGDRVRALSALGQHAEALAAERDAVAALTPDAPASACAVMAALLLERAAEPRDDESLGRAIALLDHLPAGSPLRRLLSDQLLR